MKKIRILVTGGTFDKEYDELTGRLFFRDTHVPEMLRLGTMARRRRGRDRHDDRQPRTGRCRPCGDRRAVRACDEARDRHHPWHRHDGRDRARASPTAPLAGKTIVLTGAMVPYAFGSSDGLFNLGSALSFVQVLPPGVYIAMNGQYFPWNAVRKNRQPASSNGERT